MNSKTAKIRVQWNDRPENYSRENRLTVRNYFAKKYGVDKNNIQVNFTAINLDKNGNEVEIVGATIDNIMDPNYQKELFKEWLKREEIEIDMNRLMKLDDLINNELDSDFELSKFTKWDLKWVKINNFLSYGADNKLDMSKYKGLTLISSEPANMGGKTTLAVDSLKFLFFGKTTKTDKNEDIFNMFTNEKELSVKGYLMMGSDAIIIERKLSRSPKRGDGWNVKSSLNFYKVLPDGEEVLMNEEDATRTTESIRKMVGKEVDFDITVLTTGRNLEDLIDATPTENGKLLNKFIGLEVIEIKEQIVRKKYNDFAGKKTSNTYNPIVLMEEIEQSKENLEIYNDLLSNHKETLEELKVNLVKIDTEKEDLYNSKIPIDVNLSQLNEEKILSDLEAIKNKGISLKEELDGYNKRLVLLKEAVYNEERYFDLKNDEGKIKLLIEKNGLDILNKKTTLENLVNGEICQTCNRKLDDVDHSNEINKLKKEIQELESKILVGLTSDLEKITAKIVEMNDNKLLVDERNTLEIKRDKLEVDISILQNDYKVRKLDLKKFKENEKGILKNIEIDGKIEMLKTDIIVINKSIEEVNSKINSININISASDTKINNNELLLKRIQLEIETEKIFKTYIEMVGKKGIGKLVLRSVLPIINSEINRLLEDVCDFEVELIINAKNEVEFLIQREENSKNLKSGSGFERTVSSIALRCVLSKISHLPAPNFITFDEALGKVSPLNFDKVRILFEKIKTMFDVVFLIVQDQTFNEWADNQINIKKENFISKLL